MTTGLRRLLLQVTKWMVIPSLLILLGYLWGGTYLLRAAGCFLPKQMHEVPQPQPEESKE